MRAALLVVALLVAIAIPAAGHLDHVTATPQVSPDGVVHVEKAFVAEPVWLVLHADDDGEKGAPIGHTPLDPSDRMEDVPVEIAPEVWTETDGPRTVRVDLYRDDGDGSFDADEDVSMAETSPFAPASFVVRPGEDRAYVGVSSFDDQRTSGSVVVRRAVLPEDGFVAIHNVSRGTPAEVVGHAALPAGEHEEVTIELDRGFYEQRSFSFPLVASLYVDDGDGELDAEDDPVAVGEETVSTWFRVSKQDPDATSTPAEQDLVTTRTDSTDEPASPGDSLPATWLGLAVVAVTIASLAAGGWYRLRR